MTSGTFSDMGKGWMWKEIDEGIKRMLREFEERAISEGVAKEE